MQCPQPPSAPGSTRNGTSVAPSGPSRSPCVTATASDKLRGLAMPKTSTPTKNQATKNPMDKDVASTLKRLQAKDPGLKRLLAEAYGYAVFPSVGKAALVVGGAYGRGE